MTVSQVIFSKNCNPADISLPNPEYVLQSILRLELSNTVGLRRIGYPQSGYLRQENH